MAKSSDMNFLEQHLEKAVLFVCFIFLLYAIFHWVTSSPREIEVPQPIGTPKAVAPDKVDTELSEVSLRLQNSFEKASAEPRALPPYEGIIEDYRSLKSLDGFREMVDISSARPAIREETSRKIPDKPTVADIQSVIPKPQKPKTWAGREFVRMENPADVAAAHVAFVYPISELKSIWRDRLRRTTITWKAVCLGVEAEVQERLSDGSWSAPKQVKMVSSVVDEFVRPIQLPPVPKYRGSNSDSVRNWMENMAAVDWQEFILEPGYWDVWHTPSRQWLSWVINLPVTSVSKDWMEKTPAARRTMTFAPTAPDVAARMPTAAPARTTPKPTRATPARPGAAYDPGMAMPGRPTARRTTTRQPVRRTTIPRTRTPAAPTRVVRDEPREIEIPQETTYPSLTEQIESGNLLGWFHDTSLESTKAYRYRVRLKLINPLLTWDDEVKQPEDARVAVVETPFSDWSDPVTIGKETDFYLVGSTGMSQTVKVAVFAYSLGQRVKKTFTIGVGDVIGQPRKVTLVNPATKEDQKEEVDFSTGSMVVGLDFNKTVYKGTFAKTTTEMVYLDEDGELKTRILAHDRKSDSYKKLDAEVKAANIH